MDNAVWQEVQAIQLVTAALNQMGKTGVSCAAYFGDPGLDATCAENFEDITYPDYAGYEKTEDFNCGWSSTACLQDNLDGKFVCPPEHTGSCPRPVL